MNKNILPLTIIAVLAYSASAGVPVQDMSSTSVAVDYSGVWRGEEITTSKVPAHESMHHVNIRYAPLPYAMLSAGLGAASISVDSFNQVQFKGGFNFSPSLGISLFSPPLIKKKLRITAGAKAHYFHSRSHDDDAFLYFGPVVVPNAGLTFSLSDFLDIEAGAKGLLLFGHMQEGANPAQLFSNHEQKRVYLSVMLHTPAEGAYMMFDLDGSPGIDMDWSNGPSEASIGISVGIILRQPKDPLARKLKDNADYPGFKEMQKKIEEMEKDMQ